MGRKMSGELLLEIGVEEIPAGMLQNACQKLGSIIYQTLSNNYYKNHSLATRYATPRRITIGVRNIESEVHLIQEIPGPPVNISYDEEGNPTPAAIGFAKKAGVHVDELERVQTEKGEKLRALKQIHIDTFNLLSEILPQAIKSIPWPKSMRWGDGETKFARPIRWILALYEGKVIPFEIEGVKSSNITYGHRFMAPEPFEVKDFVDYKAKLEKAYVMVDHTERRKKIEKEVRAEAKKLGGEPASRDDLFDEVTFMVEWPVVLSATFPKKYLDVPAPAIIAAMTGHQRYFPIKDKDGNLLNHFITVSNTPARDLSVVAKGNERVLNARLADAEFFYRQDLKKFPAELVDELDGFIFLKEIGSYLEKAKRLEKLSATIAGWISEDDKTLANNAARAALLCKTDLVTEMVGEFPSLQGTMGGIYSRKAEETEEEQEAAAEEEEAEETKQDQEVTA